MTIQLRIPLATETPFSVETFRRRGVSIGPSVEDGMPTRGDLESGGAEKAEWGGWLWPDFRRLMILVYATHLCSIFLLLTIIMGVIFGSATLSSNINYYVREIQPVLDEVTARSMSMLRNADNSTLHMHHLLETTDESASLALPALATSANSTAAMMNGFQHLMERPTLKLSVV